MKGRGEEEERKERKPCNHTPSNTYYRAKSAQNQPARTDTRSKMSENA